MRRRILLLVLGVTLLVVLAFTIPLVFLVRDAVAQRADQTTSQQAREVSLALRIRTYSAAQLQTFLTGAESDGRQISVTDLETGVTTGSTPADKEPVTPRPGARGAPGGDGGPPGFGGGGFGAELHQVPGGRVAVAFAPPSNSDGAGHSYLVRVFESDDVRYQGANGWYLLLAGGSVGLLLIGAGAGELLTRRITRPLVRTAETARQLAGGDTTARAPVDGPREVGEVGVALNRLADRIDELIAEERETVADLSHRLRTPLTTLRLDAEALRDPDEAERVGGHVTALERMLTAVIHAARRPQREGRIPSCDARVVVAERVEFWSALTDEQGRPSTIVLPAGPVPVRAAAEDLAAAVDALLENVVAHTPEGTAFSVSLAATDRGAMVAVGDDGPGIPPEAVERGRSDRGSTGLGLDIVRRCAEATGGAMTIGRTPAGGALVTLDLRGP